MIDSMADLLTPSEYVTCDANEAVASVAYRLNELIAIYPITPSSTMAEFSDEWAAAGKPNLWGQVPRIVEMQSEGGVAGAVHGGLLGGVLTTTFTASQGLLLMIPNLYKIAGELLPFTMHVSARALAAQGLSIFGDHQDVMACRATGCTLLCSNSGQEAHDLALVAHAASYRSRVPFIHFFDGFRTSHEVSKLSLMPDRILRSVMDEHDIADFRARAMTPDHPTLRGTAQNPDVYFQGREAVNRFYDVLPATVQATMDRLAAVTGRSYHLFEYHGHPEAERVVVAMGSAVDTVCESVDWLAARGEKVGVVAVRLFLPFCVKSFLAALPPTVKSIAVLDRTKEPGSLGEPLYLNVVAALAEGRPGVVQPRVSGGRYGLGSKEFTPAMAIAVFKHIDMGGLPLHFTVGINDDVTGLSLPYDSSFDLEPRDVRRCVFFGLGADGTVGANKNSIKIIGEQTDNFAQGYFVYDSKKSGSMTVSHLRFGPRPIRSHYLVSQAEFVACSQSEFVGRVEMLSYAAPGATVLLNSPYGPSETWSKLPREWQQELIDKKLRLYVIDATKVAHEAGMGRRTNTVLQTCFFALSGVLPPDEAVAQIKRAIAKTYARKGEQIVKMNFAAVDASLAGLHEVAIPPVPDAEAVATVPPSFAGAPEFVRKVTAELLANRGDLMPVSALPLDGCWPTGTSRFEKRNIALETPHWDPSICIQCNKCVLVCPHACIRAKFYAPEELSSAPAGFQSTPFRSSEFPGQRFSLQVAAEDCTGCTLCVQVCPAKDKTNPRHKAIDMVAQSEERTVTERANWDFFLKLPDPDRTRLDPGTVKGSQFMTPLIEFSGACAGCGETPYIKLLTQLFGDRLVIANATGCSSIYGGNLPTTPYCSNKDGRGVTWANSLFEDNAEFGMGLNLAMEQRLINARELLKHVEHRLTPGLMDGLVTGEQRSEAGIAAQRGRVMALREILKGVEGADARRLEAAADDLVKKSVWIVGGDGWAYDIGYGGLDHVLASGANVKILVLDTEVYSNTGGQASKSTSIGAVAKFASGGKSVAKKDLALIAMQYGHVYVARVALGAKDSQTVTAFREAEAYDGPAIIIAYSHCIAHGFPLHLGAEQQKLAVDTGYWPLLRYDPRLAATGEAFKLDSGAPKVELAKFTANETRFSILKSVAPNRAVELGVKAQTHVRERFARYKRLSEQGAHGGPPPSASPSAAAPAPQAATPTKPNP